MFDKRASSLVRFMLKHARHPIYFTSRNSNFGSRSAPARDGRESLLDHLLHVPSTQAVIFSRAQNQIQGRFIVPLVNER